MTLVTTILASAATTAALGGLAVLVGRLVLQGTVNAFFQRRLEQHKQKLEVLTESFKFEFERRMTDFGHYIKQRHDFYSKLYELLHVANGLVRGLWGFRTEPTYEEYSKDDMQKHLSARNVVQGKIDEVLSNWDSDREESLKEIRDYLRMLEHQRADLGRNEAKNYLLLNALYISDAVEQKASELLSKLVELYVLYDLWARHGPDLKDEYQRSTQIAKSIDALLLDVKVHMRKELSVGASGYDSETKRP